MTAEETVQTIRMLLDDSRDTYFVLSEINKVVNEVQMRFIHEAYTKEDERLLRPLYRYNTFSNGDKVLSVEGEKLLYPKSCRLTPMPNPVDDPMVTQLARYILPKDFLYYKARYFQPGAVFPREAVYTIKNKPIGFIPEAEYFAYIYINGELHTRAHLWFIVWPTPFNYTPPTPEVVDLDSYPLSIPVEYHLDVCLAAAELLNNTDVGEMERGDIAITQMGQRLKYETLSSGGPGDD